MNSVTRQQIEAQLPGLDSLARYLLERQALPNGSLVVPIVGSGASTCADLPSFSILQQLVFNKLTEGDGVAGKLATALKAEADEVLGRSRELQRLEPFEFMDVVSRFSYGRTIAAKVVLDRLKTATHRPLVYELLSHLAKHGFLDHFISLNFDELLDESLRDEIHDSLIRIISADDIPGDDAPGTRNGTFLFKPFGSLSRATFKLTPTETDRFGHQTVWGYMKKIVFDRGARPQIVLLLVGYAGHEPAFVRLMEELTSTRGRQIAVFAVDTDPTLADRLRRIVKKTVSVQQICLSADLAFDLLLQILSTKYLAKHKFGAWIPVARHQVISGMPYSQVNHTGSDDRLKAELILQAVKSRGLFTIESIAEVGRIRRYASHANTVLKEMCERKLLATKPPPGRFKRDVRSDDYVLNMSLGELAETFISDGHDRRGRDCQEVIDEWRITQRGRRYQVRKVPTTLKDQLEGRFKEIARSPDIEVSQDASPSTPWLFRECSSLTSVTKLMEATVELLQNATSDNHSTVELRGIWTTGEWLFHEDGWAFEKFGKALLRRIADGRLTMSVVLAKSPDIGHAERSKRADEVVKTLSEYKGRGCKVRFLKWGDQNRILTLLRFTRTDGTVAKSGIYMRRRLATPLVAPVSVSDSDCDILTSIFARYYDKSRSI